MGWTFFIWVLIRVKDNVTTSFRRCAAGAVANIHPVVRARDRDRKHVLGE
jgi:hypothetical protein